MTFLAPWAGLVGAAIALPVLVALYLLKLRRRPVRVSSTLLWERATHDLQVNAPLRWLRPSWLLLIQLLALLAFLAALARPALTDSGLSASRIVIIVDRSASMSARDGQGPPPGLEGSWTRLDEAKARAEELASRIGRAGGSSRTQAMVVTLGAAAQTVSPFTSSPGTLLDALRAVAPSDQPATAETLQRVLRASGVRDESETGSDAPVRAYLFSDGALGGPSGEAVSPLPQAAGVVLSLVRVGPPAPPPSPQSSAAPGGVANVGQSGHDNVGIVAINARRDYDDPAQVRLFVRLQNASATAVETALEVRVDGEAVLTRPAQVPGATPAEPGELPVSVSFVRTTGGVLTVRVLRADLLESDNSAAMVLLPPRKPSVLAVGPGAGERGPAESRGVDPFLLSALQEMELGRLVVIDRGNLESTLAQARNRASGSATTDDPLAGFDLIVLDRVRPATLPAIPTLSFGAGLPVPGLEVAPIAVAEGAEPPTVRFLAWQRTHPLLRDVGLDPVVVSPPMQLVVPPTGSDPALTVTPLAQGPDGPLIVLLESRGVRRVVVPFELRRTNWGPDFSFPVFISNAVEFLTMRGQASAAIAATTAEAVTARAAADSERLRVSGPVNFDAPLDATVDRNAVPLGVFERAGVYTVSGAPPPDDRLAVNLVNPAESLLRVVEGSPTAGTPGDSRTDGPRELWPWFVLAGLVLASVEWVIYAMRMRT